MKVRRDYRDATGKRLPGVTTILGVLNKPELFGWYAKTAAEAAARGVSNGLGVIEAITLGAAAPNAKRDAAADAGTLAHSYVEAHFADETVLADLNDDVQAGAHAVFRRVIEHLERTGVRVLRSECVLVDVAAGYGGTMDLVVERDGNRFIADLKTGKSVTNSKGDVYPEIQEQIAAYRALWLLHFPDQPIAGGLVIHAPVDGPVVEHVIDVPVLNLAATDFAAALHIYKTRPLLRREASNG